MHPNMLKYTLNWQNNSKIYPLYLYILFLLSIRGYGEMANTYAVYNSGRILLEYWCGDIYFDELLKHQAKQHCDERIQLATAEVIDFRDANIHLSDHDILSISERIIKNQPLKKVAMVIHKRDWDKASLYSRNAWDLDVDVIAFYSLEAACSWIDFDSKHIEKKLKQMKLGLMAELAT